MVRLKKRHKTINKITILVVAMLLVLITLLSVGFSKLSTNLSILSQANIRVRKDIRITGISVSSSSSLAYSTWEDYNISSIASNVVLPNADSTITYDVTITNIGNAEVGILDITGLPSNLEYSISNYSLKDTLCDNNNSSKCKLGSVTTLHITVGYVNNGFNSSRTSYNLNMDFDFRMMYSISYVGFSNVSGLANKILDGETKSITFNSTTSIPVDVSVSNASKQYSNPTLTISNATNDVIVTRYYSITYVGFPGDTTGLLPKILPDGDTITFTSSTGIPVLLTVSGATSSYNSSTHVLTLTNVISDVTITMAADGNVEITSVTLQDVSNITENSSPQITNDGRGLTFDLGITADESYHNQDYYIVYAIVINNDSVYEQKVLATNFTPNIVGTGNLPNVNYNITDSNGNSVINATIPPKTADTYYLTITIHPQEQGSWGVEGESTVDTVENGTLTGSISGSVQGDLTGSNTRAQFTASVVNSYDESKNFIFVIDDNRFRIEDSNGNAISSMTIAANTTNTYNFYIENLNGNNYISSPVGLSVYLDYDTSSSNIGDLSLLVDIDPNLSDNTAPVISNLTATTSTNQKEVTVSWSGTDDNTITDYYVEVYTSDANGNGSLHHREDFSGAPNGTQVSHNVTVPTDDAYYYFVVYGKDRAQNSATQQEIDSCTTSSGHCQRTANAKYKWNFVVTLVLDNATSSEGSTSTSGSVRTVTFNVTYDSNINTTLSGAPYYNAPNSIKSATITYPGGTAQALNSGTSSQTAYSYNTTSHVLNVYHIKGDIRIEADGSGCFAEGTKILMADGHYKNIEDINYDDLLAVWNYDTGELSYEYPLWIEEEQIGSQITRVTFEDNTYIDFVNNHGIYSMDKNLFVSIQNGKDFKIGTKVAKLENNKLVSIAVKNIETIQKEVKYYFVGTTRYYNIFANNILTTDRNLMISNLYGFDDNAKWPKEKEQILADENMLLDYCYFEDVLPYYLYKGFRVSEAGFLINNHLITLEGFKKYITSLIVNPEVIRNPITIDNNRYWMVTTSEDFVNEINKKTFLRVEGSIYVLPESNNDKFKWWYNTSDNSIYYPGDEVIVNHGTHFEAIYELNRQRKELC